jgi:hypothetical protein
MEGGYKKIGKHKIDNNRNCMRRSYTIILPHFYNLKNALAHQKNTIEASAISEIIEISREKARIIRTFFEKSYYIFALSYFL